MHFEDFFPREWHTRMNVIEIIECHHFRGRSAASWVNLGSEYYVSPDAYFEFARPQSSHVFIKISVCCLENSNYSRIRCLFVCLCFAWLFPEPSRLVLASNLVGKHVFTQGASLNVVLSTFHRISEHWPFCHFTCYFPTVVLAVNYCFGLAEHESCMQSPGEANMATPPYTLWMHRQVLYSNTFCQHLFPNRWGKISNKKG